MSEKMTCPGCDSHTSSVLSHVMKGEPCPYCGLSAQAIEEIMSVRRRNADQELKDRLEAMIKAADRMKNLTLAYKAFAAQVQTAAAQLEATLEAFKEGQAQQRVLPDGCIDGHSPSLVTCELGSEWP